jgi:hypothetical protein
MKKLLTLAIAAISVLAITAPAFAVGTPQAGDLGVFFDPAGTQTGRTGVVPFVGFNLYVVAFDVPGGMEAYEFTIQMPAGAIVSAGRVLPAGATDFGPGDDNWIVGTGGICRGQTGAFALATYNGVLFLSGPVANDVPVCLVGSSPSSFPNGAPGYLACNSPGDLRNFGAAYTGCTLINPLTEGPIANEATSWGSVKANF